MLKDRLLVARRQFAVGTDPRGILHLLLVVADLELSQDLPSPGQRGTNTSLCRVGIPTLTVPNDGRSVPVST